MAVAKKERKEAYYKWCQ